MSCRRESFTLAGLSFNEDALAAIESEIKDNSGSAIPQPMMIVGQYGSGKTTLLKRIYESVLCRKMSKVWIDGRTLFSSEDIISKAVDAGASIMFIDDMDFYLSRCTYDEQFRLRKFLNNEGAPMMIGAVGKVLPALTDYDAPFFEGLKNIYLRPVSSEEVRFVFDDQTAERADLLMSMLPLTVRSLEIVCDIININDIPKNDTAILVLMFSERYRCLYQELPVNSQHILNAFGTDGDPMTMPRLREITGLPTNVLTAYLKNLGLSDIIKIDKSQKRNTKYSVKDPLFRLWLGQSEHP